VTNTLFECATGSFQLHRYPARASETLQAWNAADLLLIEQCAVRASNSEPLLVANDEHGALTVALQAEALWTDSALSIRASQDNLQRNALQPVTVVPATEVPAGNYSSVVMKVPKQLPYFEYQLAILAQVMGPGTALLVAGMDKHLSPRVAELLEQYIGPAERHRGERKARVFTALRDERVARQAPGNSSYHCDALGGDIVSLANVFSREKLDIGSRFLIEQLGLLEPANNVIDLACGNGLLGLVAKTGGLYTGQLGFCDESAMAIASAQINAQSCFPQESDDFSFQQLDGLLGYEGEQADLILCNPPFHSGHVVDEFVGQRLIQQAASYLQTSGRLCIVANRHLKYSGTLKRGFSSVEKLAQNNKFIVWLATK